MDGISGMEDMAENNWLDYEFRLLHLRELSNNIHHIHEFGLTVRGLSLDGCGRIYALNVHNFTKITKILSVMREEIVEAAWTGATFDRTTTRTRILKFFFFPSLAVPLK